MKTIQHTLFKLMLVSGLFLSADAALADGRSNSHNVRSSHDNHWSAPARNYTPPRNTYVAPRNNYNSGYSGGSSARWSVNLNFGSPGYWGSGLSYGRVYSPPVIVSPAPRIIVPAAPPVVINNTYVTTPSYAAPAAPSLFRDLYGRCYERSYNAQGAEIRTEVHPSLCNF
ncbi:MAG: hypothetical protein LBF16_14135 [Pseudomonadales bacterium]|jgi:hypothetical protein|nr:hypothetical protein [Pseudomonadales bacterium]